MKPKRSQAALKIPPKRSPAKVDYPLFLAELAYRAASDTKAHDIVGLDLRKKASYADYLVICSGTNTRQVQAIAERIQEMMHRELKKKPLGIEGCENGIWVLLDYGDIVCHIFLDEARDFYRLEHLWHDAKRVKFKKIKS